MARSEGIIFALACVHAAVGAAVTEMPCAKEFPGGVRFDLSPLTRFPGEMDWSARDEEENEFFLNVCAPSVEVPESCLHSATENMAEQDIAAGREVKSPAYVLSASGDKCISLGELQTESWALLNENDPEAGLELTYSHGEVCQDGTASDISYQFHCNSMGGSGSPDLFGVRRESDCRYIVEWSTIYACPKKGLSPGWIFISMLVFGVIVYLGIGCAYNHVVMHYRIGWEALPHSLFWRNLPGLVGDGLRFTAEFLTNRGDVQVAKERAMGGGSYGKMDGVEYEWS